MATSAVPELRRSSRTRPLGACSRALQGPGRLVAMVGADGTLRAWRRGTEAWASRCTPPPGVRIRELAWSPWPRHLATAQDDGTVVVWDLQQEVAVRVLRPEAEGVAAMAFTRDGRWLVVVGRDRSVELFDAEDQARWSYRVPDTPTTGWAVPPRPVGPAVLEAGDRHLVVAANDGAVVRLDVRGEVVTTWRHPHEVHRLAVSSAHLVTWSVDDRLRFWSLSGELLHRVDESAAPHLAFGADGSRLVAGGADGRVRIWSPEGAVLGTADAAGPVVGVGYGDAALTCSSDGVLETWTTADDEGSRA